MSMAMQNEINELRQRVSELEQLCRNANAFTDQAPHLATKDNLFALEARIGALEVKVEAIGRKVKV